MAVDTALFQKAVVAVYVDGPLAVNDCRWAQMLISLIFQLTTGFCPPSSCECPADPADCEIARDAGARSPTRQSSEDVMQRKAREASEGRTSGRKSKGHDRQPPVSRIRPGPLVIGRIEAKLLRPFLALPRLVRHRSLPSRTPLRRHRPWGCFWLRLLLLLLAPPQRTGVKGRPMAAADLDSPGHA